MADFEVVRDTTIRAPAERVHGMIDDFRAWRAWSPWEDVDPDLKREYGGPESGVGARYAWEGNRKAGKGHMEIVGDTPERVDVRLVFEKPWKADNAVDFTLQPTDGGGSTQVTWRMTGTNKGVAGVVGKVLGMDRLVGRDFEKGLARMKAAAESGG